MKKLDEALARHPAVAYAVQRLGLPGKRGRPRRRVANIDRDPSDGFSQVDIGPLEVAEEDGKKVVLIKPILDPRFDLRRFRRALHMVALNYLAHQHGAARALDSQFDAVRSYIRGTRRGQAWPFLVCYRPGPVLKEIRFGLYEPDEFGLVAHVGMFNHDFYVDLLNTGNLGHWSLAAELTSAQFVRPEDIYPASPRAEAVPLRKRGRLRVSGEN
jgi:hypothetical protein